MDNMPIRRMSSHMSILNDVLGRYPAPLKPHDFTPLENAGGMSGARIWRGSTQLGEFALRRWPVEGPPPERLAWIHGVLARAAERGIDFVPVPLKTRDGRRFTSAGDHLWQLEPWMAGRADYHFDPTPPKLAAALVALARFHRATGDAAPQNLTDWSPAELPTSGAMKEGPSPAIARRAALLTELTPARIGELARSLRATGPWSELAELAQDFLRLLPHLRGPALDRLLPLVHFRFPLQPCLRDIWHDHVLFTGDRVTGVIDFGAMEIDTPATDIARLLGSLAEDDEARWKAGLEAYQSVRPLSPRELEIVAPLDASSVLLGACNWLRWIFIDGRKFADRDQITRRFQRLVTRARRMAATGP